MDKVKYSPWLVSTLVVSEPRQGKGHPNLLSSHLKIKVVGYSEMMDMNIKLTNKKKNSFQCYHNNRGYCKFQEECRFQHFKEVCQKRLCKDIECEKRHPKPCRNGLYCKFNKVNNCYFRHEDSNEEQNIEKEEMRKKLKEYD